MNEIKKGRKKGRKKERKKGRKKERKERKKKDKNTSKTKKNKTSKKKPKTKHKKKTNKTADTGDEMRLAPVFVKAFRTYGRTDGWIDRHTLLIEMRRRI